MSPSRQSTRYLSNTTSEPSSRQIFMAHHQVNTAQLALKQNCKHPETGKPYILSFEGGKENSPEGLQVC